jgi:hypothetical protein
LSRGRLLPQPTQRVESEKPGLRGLLAETRGERKVMVSTIGSLIIPRKSQNDWWIIRGLYWQV